MRNLLVSLLGNTVGALLLVGTIHAAGVLDGISEVEALAIAKVMYTTKISARPCHSVFVISRTRLRHLGPVPLAGALPPSRQNLKLFYLRLYPPLFI